MFFPAGQQRRFTGPLYQLQDGLTVGLLTGAFGSSPDPRIATGITRCGNLPVTQCCRPTPPDRVFPIWALRWAAWALQMFS